MTGRWFRRFSAISRGRLNTKAVWTAVVLLAVAFECQAARLDRATKPVTVSARILGRVPLEKLSSIGVNYESYLAQVSDPSGHFTDEYIKLSYRFHLRDSRMSPALFDYNLVHQFRMTREVSCDEPWETMSTRYRFDRDGKFQGKEDAVLYAQNAPRVELDSQTVLHCYTVRPLDYKSTASHRLSASSGSRTGADDKTTVEHAAGTR